jgi:hypothetical protein
MVQHSVVFVNGDGEHLTKYVVTPQRRWHLQLREDCECAPPDEITIRFNGSADYPSFGTMSSVQLQQHFHTTTDLLDTAPAYLVIGRIMFPGTNGTATFYVTLVANDVAAGCAPGLTVAFLQSTKGHTQADFNRYYALNKKKKSSCNILLCGDIKLNTFADERYYLKFLANDPPNGDQYNTWVCMVAGQRPDLERKKRTVGQILELPLTTSAALKQKTQNDFPVRMTYKGGKKHAPQRAYNGADDCAALLSAEFEARPQPLSDYHLHEKRVQEQYFQQLILPSKITAAIARVRDVASASPHCLSETVVEDIVGALSSNFYEDICWRMPASPPRHRRASLSYCSVDIDQVCITSSCIAFTSLRPYLLRYCCGDLRRLCCT